MRIYPENTAEKLGFDFLREATIEKTRSDVGREFLEALTPSSDWDVVEVRLRRTAEGMKILRIGDPLPHDEMPDVRPALKRARPEGSLLDPLSLLHIGKILVGARRVKQYFQQRNELYPAWNDLCEGIIPLKQLEEEIFRILTDHGNIKDSASPELQSIRRNLNARRNDLRSTLNKLLRQASKDGYLSEQEPTIRGGRMVLAVRAEHKRKISGFIHDTSSTGQTVYLEPVEALHINNDIRQLENDETREIERLLRILTAKVRTSISEVGTNATLLGEVDAGMAIARLSDDLNGTIPELTPDAYLPASEDKKNRKRLGTVKLVKAYNPHLLLKSLKAGNVSSVVPLDLEMTLDELCLIITGPNAGGKSVALKTLGLHAIMIQSGFAVPLKEGSKMPVFGSMYVDMGDEQSIENDLSTFSSRLTWMRKTAVQADWQSLVLIDEAGTGTDPEEGVALYQAMLEDLISRNCLTAVTTHHGNLKVFAHNHPNAVNGSMEFDQTHLSPTYRFRKGLPGSSYAFEIAQRIGVPATLLTYARTLIGDRRNRLEHLIADLEKNTQAAELARAELEKQLTDTRKLIREYEQKSESILKERDKIREKALIEARNIMQGANKRVEEAVRKIAEEKAGKKEVRQIRKELESAQAEVVGELADLEEKDIPKVLGTPPVVGDSVKMLDGNTTGELVEISGNQAVVLTNGLRLKTKYKNLVKVELPKKKKELTRVVVLNSGNDDDVVRTVSSSVDLRGKRGDEAINELTYYLDRAISSGLGQVEIIHGKGDGILRKLVHNYLRDRREVREFNLAPWEQGGPGCTIAVF